MYIGSWKINDLLTFTVNTHSPTTGEEIDADSLPTYRIYEDETTVPVLTGSMAKLDDANTLGFYSEQITLSAANGFEKGKCYNIRINAVVDGVSASTLRKLQIEAEVDANVVSDKTGYSITGGGTAPTVQEIVDGMLDELLAGHNVSGSVGEALSAAGVAGDPLLGTVETGLTLKNAIRLLVAFVCGKTTGGGSNELSFRDYNDELNRIVMTLDSDNNRLIVTRDLT